MMIIRHTIRYAVWTLAEQIDCFSTVYNIIIITTTTAFITFEYLIGFFRLFVCFVCSVHCWRLFDDQPWTFNEYFLMCFTICFYYYYYVRVSLCIYDACRCVTNISVNFFLFICMSRGFCLYISTGHDCFVIATRLVGVCLIWFQYICKLIHFVFKWNGCNVYQYINDLVGLSMYLPKTAFNVCVTIIIIILSLYQNHIENFAKRTELSYMAYNHDFSSFWIKILDTTISSRMCGNMFKVN